MHDTGEPRGFQPHPFDRVRALLNGVKRSGRDPRQYRAPCPAHHDRRASLSIRREPDRVVLNCHAGCDIDDILRVLGLTFADLFVTRFEKRTERVKLKPCATLPGAIAEFVRAMRWEPSATTTYEYRKRDATLWGVVCRFDFPDRPKEIRPFRQDRKGAWRLGVGRGLRPLYRLGDILARPDERVVVVEGERCVEALRSLGVLACTSFGGANGAGRADWRPLKGRRVVLLGDNDDAGEAYVADVCEGLRALRPRADVVVVPLPVEHEGDDVCDWLAALPDGWEIERVCAELSRLEQEAREAARRPTLKVVRAPIEAEVRDPRPATLRCAAWLVATLENGPIASLELIARARNAGYPPQTLKRSKPLANVESFRDPEAHRWLMRLRRD
jgi:hypothetical protein